MPIIDTETAHALAEWLYSVDILLEKRRIGDTLAYALHLASEGLSPTEAARQINEVMEGA